MSSSKKNKQQFTSLAKYALPLLCSLISTGCAATHMGQRADVKQFINHVSKKDNFDKQELVAIFSDVKSDPRVIKAISKPAEAKPWVAYRKIFITPTRIEEGVAFWQTNADTLARAEQQYGVPAHIIVAILGVETGYGKHQGNFKVLDSLSTLAFDYPPRAPFFRQELEHFLLLTREQNFAPHAILGSYAGAIGQPQFMPSSYRQYAVDFSGHGQIDLLHNTGDSIGSIANYLRKKGWQPGHTIAMPAKISQENNLPNPGKQPGFTLEQLAQRGVKPTKYLPPQTKANLIAYDTESEREFWLAFENFYVIKRYNTSNLYAMAVYQLAEEIRTKR